jgi:hypothetical protein
MRAYRSFARLARAPCRWGCGLLLLCLAACGTAEPTAAPQAGAATVAGAEATTVMSLPPTSADTLSPAQPAPTGLPIVPPTARPPTTALPASSPLPTEHPLTTSSLATPQRPPPTPVAAPTSGAAPATSATWQTYRNEQAGYSVAYPPGWRTTERAATPPKFATSFAPAGGGTGILVAVRPLAPEQREPVDLPNTRCKPVSVGGLSGVRCFDSIASTILTTLVGKDRQFTISASGRRLDQAIYQRFLDSFQALS